MINYVEWHLTNKCNLKCLHCMCNSNNEEEINEKQINKTMNFIYMLSPINVNLTGGEPLLYSNIFDLCNRLNAKGINISLSTNGYKRINKNVANKIISKINGGIQISLDSYDEEIHDNFRQQEGAFKNSLDFIETIRRISIDYDIQICMCLNKSNYKEILNYEYILDFYKISSFKVLSMYDLGRAKRSALQLNDNQVIEAIDLCKRLNNRLKYTNVYYSNPLLYFNFLVENNRFNKIEMLNIDSNGLIKISPYLVCQVGSVNDEWSRKDLELNLDKIVNNINNRKLRY